MSRTALARSVWLLLAFWLGGSSLLAADETGTAPEVYLKLLKETETSPERTSLSQLLRTLVVPADQSKLWLAGLGSNDWNLREATAEALAGRPLLPLGQLQQWAQSSDLEVRLRARALLREHQPHTSWRLRACYETIIAGQIKGLAAEVMSSLGRLPDDAELNAAATSALLVTLSANDLPLIKKGLAAKPPRIRTASALALAQLNAAETLAILVNLSNDPEPEVQLAATRGLLHLGDRAGLAAAMKLLDAPKGQDRTDAAKLLWGVLAPGKWDLVPYTTRSVLVQQKKQLQTWLETEPQLTPLRLDPRPPMSESIVLVLEDQIVCVDRKGTTLEHFPRREGVGAVQKVGQEGILYSLPSKKQLYFLSAKNQMLPACPAMPGIPTSFELLPNRHLLIGCTQPDCILELDPQGKLYGRVNLPSRSGGRAAVRAVGPPASVQRLDDGDTLVALPNMGSVIAVDQHAHVDWHLSGLQVPTFAELLPGGTCLVCERGRSRVTEYDRSGNPLWSYAAQDPIRAWREPNGLTLIATRTEVIEVDPFGQQAASFRHADAQAAWLASEAP